MADISFKLEGDINSGRGALGLTANSALTVPNTVLWTAFPAKPHRYYLTPSGFNSTVTLPVIGSDNTNIGTAKIGHTIFIYNKSGVSNLNVNNSASTLIATISPGAVYTFSASSAPSTWISTNLSSGGGGSLPLTTKGDLLTRNIATDVRLPVGADGEVLTADSTAAEGIAWKPATGGGHIAYTLSGGENTAINTFYTSILYFPWDNSRYSGYTNATIIYNVEIVDRNLDIIVRDVNNAVTLGSDLNVSASGIRSFSILNPTSNTKISIDVRKSTFSGTSPAIFGINLEFTE